MKAKFKDMFAGCVLRNRKNKRLSKRQIKRRNALIQKLNN